MALNFNLTSTLNSADITASYASTRHIYLFGKRCFDIVCSLLAIVLLSPVMLIVAILVYSTSKGSILFKDKRVGKDGKDIYILKFRTMVWDSEINIDKYLNKKQKRQWETERKIIGDPRLTKIGKFLRKSSIDELPQLFNVLYGNLSLIGARPITRYELEKHFNSDQQKILLSMKPGVTGYWAVSGRNNITYTSGSRQRIECAYVSKASVALDTKILLRTIPTVLKMTGDEIEK